MNFKKLLLIVLCFFVLPSSVLAQGALTPTNVYGQLFVDSIEAPTGTIFYAEYSGVNVSTDGWTDAINYTAYNASYSDPTQRYFLHVQWYDPANPPSPIYGISNANSGVTPSFKIAGLSATPSAAVSLSYQNPGNLNVNFSATDNVGPTAPGSINAAETTVTNQSTVNVSWTSSTDNIWSNLTYYVYRGSSSSVSSSDTLVGSTSLDGSGTLSMTETVSSRGTTYYYTVYANDTSGNLGSRGTPDSVTVTNLVPAQVTGLQITSSNRTINLTWTAVTTHNNGQPIGSDIVGYHVYWNNSGTWTLVSTTTNTYYNNGSLTNSQTYMYKVAAYDLDGNEGTNSTTVSATPSERPSLSASPASGTTIKSSVIVNISITSGQNLDTVQYVVYNSTGATIDAGQTNASVAATTWTYNINPAAWVEGVGHSVYVFANDTNGQSNQQNFTYTTDDTNPAVSSDAISSSLVKSTTTVQLNVTVTDASTISSVTAANGSSVAMGVLSVNVYSVSTNASALGCTATNGACLVTFTATDAAGNANSTTTLSFNIDDVVPAVSAAAVNDTLLKSTDAIRVNVTVTDTNSVSSVIVSGGTNVSMSNITATVYSVDTTPSALGCSEGACTLTFTAIDELGNTNNTVTTAITVDDTAPAVTAPTTNDSDGIVKSTDSLNITVTVSDTNGVTSVTVNGTTMTQIGSTTTWSTINTTADFGCTTDGSCVLTFVAIDTVGNTNNTATLTLTVDDTAPVLNITAPLNASTKNNSYFAIAFNVNETNPHATTFCNYTLVKNSTTTHSDLDIDANEMTQVGTVYSYTTTLTAVANGNYTLTVVCKDKNSQTTTLAYGFVVNDTVAPSVTEITTSSSGRKPVTMTLSVTTNEAATCKYSTENVTYASMTAMTTTGGTSHSVDNSYTVDTTGTYYVLCSDTAGNIMSALSSTTFTADVRSSSSGGGGGSGVAAPVTAPTYAKAWSQIPTGSLEKVTINKDIYKEVPFTVLEFKPTKDINNVELKVVALTTPPTTTGAIKKKAYKYIQITEKNINEGDLTDTKVEFKVEKSWLISNSLSKEQVALFRYTNNAWMQQETSVASEDSTYVYYKSVTSGFSYFAIGEKEEVTQPAQPPATTPTTPTETPAEQPPATPPAQPPAIPPTQPPAQSEEKLPSRGAALWGFISMFVVIALLFVFWKEGKLQQLFQKQKEHGVHKPHDDAEKLDKFIREQLNEGHDAAHIKTSLLEAGWKKEKVDEALKKYKK